MLRFSRRRLHTDEDPELIPFWDGALERAGKAPGLSHADIPSHLQGAINGAYVQGIRVEQAPNQVLRERRRTWGDD